MAKQCLRDAMEREALVRFKGALDTWALDDARRAAQKGLPRLAFIGTACWFETVATYATPYSHERAWVAYFERFVPSLNQHSKVIYEGLRCRLVHNYGTNRVILTAGNPSLHGQVVADQLLLNVESLIDDAQRAFDLMMVRAEEDLDLRRRLVRVSRSIMAPTFIRDIRELDQQMTNVAVTGVGAPGDFLPYSRTT